MSPSVVSRVAMRSWRRMRRSWEEGAMRERRWMLPSVCCCVCVSLGKVDGGKRKGEDLQ